MLFRSLDSFDQVGRAVGHLFGRLDKVSLGNGVGCLGGRQAAGVTQSRGVLCHYGGCRENLGEKQLVTKVKKLGFS